MSFPIEELKLPNGTVLTDTPKISFFDRLINIMWVLQGKAFVVHIIRDKEELKKQYARRDAWSQ